MAEMTEAMAREIVDAAARTGAWEEAGETAKSITAERAFADAAQLTTIAREVYDKRNPGDPLPEAVKEILFASQIEPVDGKYADVYEGKGDPPASNGSASAQEQPATPTEATQETHSAPESLDDVYPGYDDQKAKDIVAAVTESAASGDLTPEEWAKIKAYEEANEGRKGILSLEPQFKPKEQPPTPAAQQPVSSTSTNEPGDYASAAHFEQAYQDGTLGTDRVRQESLPIPPQVELEALVLPVDITETPHQELSRLAMQFHSLEARALWLLSQEEGRQEAAASLRHDSHRAAFAREFARLKSEIDASKSTHVEQARSEANKLADDDGSVSTWRNRERHHGAEARSLKALLEGYQRATARLSREQARRENLATKG